MDEEIERLVVSVRADTRAFARDVEEMRRGLEGPLGAGVDRAGRLIEGALLRAVRTGKLGFEELKTVALGVLAEIADTAIRSGLAALFGGGGGGRTGGGAIPGLPPIISGFPGRATGGPVAPGRAYLVGERGPELFVPSSSGRVEANGSGGPRDVRLSITVNAGGGGAEASRLLARSGRQVARAVVQAMREER